jgi:hypothetical protein
MPKDCPRSVAAEPTPRTEGYSIPAQRKLLAQYATTHTFRIEQEFIDIESAKNPD